MVVIAVFGIDQHFVQWNGKQAGRNGFDFCHVSFLGQAACRAIFGDVKDHTIQHFIQVGARRRAV